MKSQNKVITVIVNYRRPDDTIACIRSILADYQQGEILVVDNGSGDESPVNILQAAPRIRLLQLPNNTGFAGGYNAGIQAALETKDQSIFLLNNDTEIEPGCLTALVASNSDVAVPKILYYNQPDIIWAAGARWRKFPPAIVMNGYRQKDGPLYDQPRALQFATGCALLVKREVLVQVGGFDTLFANYMEDYDFSYRVVKAGFRMRYIPQARVLHKVSQTLGEANPRRWYYLGQNTVLFYRKDERYPATTLWAYLAWFTIRETLKGQSQILAPFWQGVKNGFKLLKEID